jgi:hypothetical protein
MAGSTGSNKRMGNMVSNLKTPLVTSDGDEKKKKDAPRPKLKILGEEVTVPKGNPRTPDWVDSEGNPHYTSKGGRFGGPEK